MTDDNLVIKVLERIHAEIAGMRTEISGMRTEFRHELTALREELHTEAGALREEMTGLRSDFNVLSDRAERGFRDVGAVMREIALDQRKHETFHSQHVEKLENDVDDLKARVQKLEDRVGEPP